MPSHSQLDLLKRTCARNTKTGLNTFDVLMIHRTMELVKAAAVIPGFETGRESGCLLRVRGQFDKLIRYSRKNLF
jgi:hypothetical protein